MDDLLRQGSQWLESMREKHLSSPVTYRRGETELTVNATFGRTEYEVEDGYGLRISADVMDFVIAASELLDTFGKPQAGDQVVVDDTIYEVMDLGSQGHWRWSDPYKSAMRIHTKEVG